MADSAPSAKKVAAPEQAPAEQSAAHGGPEATQEPPAQAGEQCGDEAEAGASGPSADPDDEQPAADSEGSGPAASEADAAKGGGRARGRQRKRGPGRPRGSGSRGRGAANRGGLGRSRSSFASHAKAQASALVRPHTSFCVIDMLVGTQAFRGDPVAPCWSVLPCLTWNRYDRSIMLSADKMGIVPVEQVSMPGLSNYYSANLLDGPIPERGCHGSARLYVPSALPGTSPR